jgi:hypothetical protein
MATSITKSKPRWQLAAALLAPPLIALLLIVLSRLGSEDLVRAEDGTPTAAVAPPAERHAPACVRLAPTAFSVTPGGIQELTAIFWGNVGEARFTWSASGGMLSAIGETTTRARVEGYIMGDDFDGDALETKLWKTVVPAGASVVQAGGMVTIKQSPGAAVRLENVFELQGNFTAELTVVSLEAEGNRGSAGLSFRTADGFEAEASRVARNAIQTLELTTFDKEHKAHGSTSVADPGGPVRLRLVRNGTNVGAQTEAAGNLIQLGSRVNAISAAPAKVVIASASREGNPAVTTVVDNFIATQNMNVAWHAPPDAAIDTLYTISITDTCTATARIVAP